MSVPAQVTAQKAATKNCPQQGQFWVRVGGGTHIHSLWRNRRRVIWRQDNNVI